MQTRHGKLIISAAAVLMYITGSFATTLDGSTGLIWVPYASTLGKSKLLVNGQAAATLQKGTSYDGFYYHAINQVGAIYGMNQYWDVWMNFRGYQDNPTKPDEGWGNLKLGTKYNAYNNRRLRLSLAEEFILIIPTGKWENIDWEPYSSGNLEFQFNTIATYQKYYHGVFGYIYHNDADIGFHSNFAYAVPAIGLSATHELFTGIGGEYPVIKDILLATGELTGRFILNPKKYMRSSEPWIQTTLGTKYFLSDNLFISGGLDLRLYGKNFDPDIDRFANATNPPFFADCDNYPLWKLHLDVNWVAYQKYRVVRRPQGERDEFADDEGGDEDYLNLINDFGSVEVSQELQQKMELYKQLKLQQKETKEAEQELEEIKMKRQEAEKELSKLRNLLEDLE